MKFPKSVHPEGWLDHIDRDAAPAAARPAGAPLKPRTPRPSAKIRATDPLGAEPLHATAATMAPPQATPIGTPAATQRAGGSSMPWIIGTVAGAALIGGAAFTMSRQTAGPEAPAVPPVLLGEVTPPAANASSAEDSLLAQAPTAAGIEAPTAAEPPVAPVASPPPAPAPQVAATPAPKAPAPTPKVAEAPKLAEAPKAEAPAPVARVLTPPPETLAQASPPPVMPQEAAPAAEPSLPQPAEPVITPPTTAPLQPPVLAQTTPPAADPADVGITVKVREALASDATLAALPIAVSTDQGVVKLEGQAPDVQARERATVVAAATAGVRGVDNRLTLPSVTVGALQGHGS